MTDNGFARAQADYDAQMPLEGDLAPIETRVLRAVVYLTYDGGDAEDEDDEGVEGEMTASMMGLDMKRVLSPRNWGGGLNLNRLLYPADKVEVVDAEWISPEEADSHPLTPFANVEQQQRDVVARFGQEAEDVLPSDGAVN
jgi:hypothetical protein